MIVPGILAPKSITVKIRVTGIYQGNLDALLEEKHPKS